MLSRTHSNPVLIGVTCIRFRYSPAAWPTLSSPRPVDVLASEIFNGAHSLQRFGVGGDLLHSIPMRIAD